ncbi:hypothetical protein DL771_002382 [Monosporascus sp. 5C6A]|nr:hypothetical protein DL771_002382 [Monosporascus sp. 5C6A]
MEPASKLSPVLELDGFMLAPVKEPALSALQQPVEGIEAIDGLAGSHKAALEGYVYHNLLNLLIIAIKLKNLWERKDDRENYEGYIQAIAKDWGVGPVGSSKFLLTTLKIARRRFLVQFKQELKGWRHEVGVLDVRRAAADAAEYCNTLKDIMTTSKKPRISFSLPHNPLAEEKIEAIATKDARACEDAQDCEKLAQSLEDEIRTRAILDERQEGGVIPQKIDRKDIRVQLEGMSLEFGYAIAAMLVSVRRARHIRQVTMDSFVWGELCEEACNILVFGRSLGQSDSFQAFLERLIAWSQRLLVAEEDQVQKARLEEETKDFPVQEESDTDIKIILD